MTITRLATPALLALLATACSTTPDGPITGMDLVAAAKAEITEVAVADAAALIEAGAFVLDVREPGEYDQGHLDGAVNIPRGLLEFRITESEDLTGRDAPIVLYCRTGGRGALAAQTLQDMGYSNVVSIAGGYSAWQEAGMPVAGSDEED